MNCGDIHKFVHAYLDNEFADDERHAFEHHLEQCSTCRETTHDEQKFHYTMRAKLRALPNDVPPELFTEIEQAINVESRAISRSGTLRWVSGSLVASAALAAGILLVVRHPHTGASADSVVEAVVQNHQRNLPMEVAGGDAASVQTWFQGKVDVPVRAPQAHNARLVGARVSHVREKDAAQLVYDRGGRKFSVLIFDPRGLEMHAPRRQRVGNRDVMMEGHRGYNVALFEDRGLGYAVAADANDREVLDFINASLTNP